MRKLATAVVVVAAVAPIPVLAQAMEQWYIGAGAGRGSATISPGDVAGASTQIDDTDTAYTVRAGWRFHRNFALELGYYDLGSYGFRTSAFGGFEVKSRAKSYGASFVAIAPINAFDIYGRVGYARSEMKSSVSGSSTLLLNSGTTDTSKDHQNEAIYGVGGRWNAGPQWGLFAEWMRNDKLEVDSYMLGVDFKF